MTDTVISFRGLGHAYRPGHWVIRNYQAAIKKGRVSAILGPNGGGKTTLLRLLLGTLRPTEGEVLTEGQIAFVPQSFQVAFEYSAFDMVIMGRARHIGFLRQPGRDDKAAAWAALGRLGLTSLAKKPFHELSGGQRQLVMLARALVTHADILIMDEPTSALDVRNQALVLDQIDLLARGEGLTVLFTTHNPQHALDVADDALLMLDHQRLATGSVREILSEENLLDLYGIPLRRFRMWRGKEEIEAISLLRPRRNSPHPFRPDGGQDHRLDMKGGSKRFFFRERGTKKASSV